MKQIYILLLIFLFSNIIFGQELKFDKAFIPNIENRGEELFSIIKNQQEEIQKFLPSRTIDEVRWVNDSVKYAIKGKYGNWNVTSIYSVTEFDNHGNNIAGIKKGVNSQGHSWIPYYKDKTSYFNDDIQKEYLTRYILDDKYVDTSEYVLNNPNGDWILKYHKGTSDPSSKFERKFNDDGRLIEYGYYERYSEGSSWEPIFRYVYSFDQNIKPTVGTVQKWSVSGWTNYYKEKYFYNNKNEIIKSLVFSWDLQLNNWVELYKKEFFYNDQGSLIEEKSRKMIKESGIWENYIKYVFEHDEDGFLLNSISLQWSNEFSEWVNSRKISNKYNLEKSPLTIKTEFWIVDSNFWKVTYQTNYKYDEKNNLIEEVHQSDDKYGNYKVFYTWKSLDIVNPILELNKSGVEIYPNPSSGLITIKNSNALISSVEIFSINGKSLLKKEKNFDEINISSLNDGVYFIKVVSGKDALMQKILLRK